MGADPTTWSTPLTPPPIMVVNRFLGSLAVLALLATVAAIVMLVTRRIPAWAADLALPLAAVIATVTTLGSLYYSEIAGYPPCTLCWYQRIAIYPQVVLLGVAAWRRDVTVWLPSTILATIGIALSTWHVIIERNPALAGPCDPSNPCTLKWVEEFGFLTIPFMALIAGISFIALTLLARTAAGAVTSTTDRSIDR
jgi:disulfide bond formation protein DsbB